MYLLCVMGFSLIIQTVHRFQWERYELRPGQIISLSAVGRQLKSETNWKTTFLGLGVEAIYERPCVLMLISGDNATVT